jgi:hypothetical protein
MWNRGVINAVGEVLIEAPHLPLGIDVVALGEAASGS